LQGHTSTMSLAPAQNRLAKQLKMSPGGHLAWLVGGLSMLV
jgi:hypothetical protein